MVNDCMSYILLMYQFRHKKIYGKVIQKIALWLMIFAILFIFNKASAADVFPAINKINKDTVQGQVNVKVIARKSNSVFWRKKIHYRIHIANTYKEPQDGTITYEVRNEKNKQLLGTVYKVHIDGKSSIDIKTKFKVPGPGFYDYITRINLSDYEDTIKTVFGYKPNMIRTPLHKPADFDQFWNDAKKELANVEPKYTIEYSKTLSTRTHKYYNVQMQSLNDITIHGWISVPRLPGKFPVLLVMPGYKQILQPMFPDDQAIFCLSVRSLAQLNKKNMNPRDESEYCTVNIDDKNSFIYRGAYMDCLRAVDFIMNNYQIGLDTSRIIVFGGSQGGSFALVTAALDHRVAICGADNPIFCDFHNYFDIANSKTSDAFPIKYYNWHLRQTATLKDNLLRTLDYFDVQNFITYIQCPSLLVLGTLDPIAPPGTVYAAYNKLNHIARRKSEIHILTNIGHEITEEYSFIKFLWIEENTVNGIGH